MAAPASYKPQAVRRLFDRMAPSYDWVQRVTSFGFSARWRRQLLHPLPGLPAGGAVLDLMTGRGEMWPAIVQKYPDADWHALDFSQGMLAQANRQNERKHRGRFHVTNRDAFQTSYADDAYDTVVCAFGLKTLKESYWKQLAAEMARILKPGGTFACIEVSLPPGAALRSLYRFYLRRIVPVAGMLARGNGADYRLLWTYTKAFDNCSHARSYFSGAGFVVKPHRYFWGCATGFTATKNPTYGS